MTRIDKPETDKVATYRQALHKIAKAPDGRHAALEGKAAKLGVEIQGEESKATPNTPIKETRHAPRR